MNEDANSKVDQFKHVIKIGDFDAVYINGMKIFKEKLLLTLILIDMWKISPIHKNPIDPVAKK
jgi:hypothetical protein